MTQTASRARTGHPAAGLDRRFYAFVLDRLLVWGLYAVGAYLAHRSFFSTGRAATGVGLVVAVVLVLGLAHAALLGLAGLSPGKAAAGLRVVDQATGRPIGFGRAVVRTLVLGVAGLPTFTLGVASLAWTAVMDRSGFRRGWHDQVTGSVVVDVRPLPAAEVLEENRPRQVVNLTAMRLMPAPSAPAPSAPAPAAPAPQVPQSPQSPVLTPSAPRTPPPPRAHRAEPSLPRPEPPPETLGEGPPPVPSAPPTAPVPTPLSSAPPLAPPSGPAPSPTRPPAPQSSPPSSPSSAARPSAPPPARPPAPLPAPPRGRPSTPGAGSPATTGWRVTFDTGEAFVVEGLALVGRRPEGRAGESVRHLVPLRSTDMSLSKTHAQFQVAPDGALVVMDRGSTNGSVLVRQGVAKVLSPGRASTLLAGDRVRFGDREMRVERG